MPLAKSMHLWDLPKLKGTLGRVCDKRDATASAKDKGVYLASEDLDGGGGFIFFFAHLQTRTKTNRVSE